MTWYCTRCEHFGEPKTVTPGSFLIEVLLWICFLVPGMIYSIWRLSARYRACAVCQSRELVPSESRVAQRQIQSDPEIRAAHAQATVAGHSRLRSNLAWLAVFILIAIGIVLAR